MPTVVVTTIGADIAFGIEGSLVRLKGFPPGKVRIRMRPDDYARVYVRNATGTVCYYALREGDHWIPGPVEGTNLNGYSLTRDACPLTNKPRNRLLGFLSLLSSARTESVDASGGRR